MAECKECGKRNWNPFEDICSDCLIDFTVAKTKADGAAERELAQQETDLARRSIVVSRFDSIAFYICEFCLCLRFPIVVVCFVNCLRFA